MKLFNNPCKKRDRKGTETALLTAAGKLFAEKGYENTRTLEIAKEAGANEALIGRYFGGKEGLLIALMKDQVLMKGLVDQEKYAKLELFPAYPDAKSLKEGAITFFKNGEEMFKMKEQFARIGCARMMVDPEMAAVFRTHLLDDHLPKMIQQLKTYPDMKKLKKADLEAIGFLIMSVNFNMNFMGRKIHQFDPSKIDDIFQILASSLQALLDSKA